MHVKPKRKGRPETYIYTGTKNKPTTINHIQYSFDTFSMYDSLQSMNDDAVDWISVEGLSNIKAIESICKTNNILPLTIEDILNVSQRTKIEIMDDYIFTVIQYSYLDNDRIKQDYLSLVLFEDKLLTFSDGKNRLVQDILQRIEQETSYIRKKKHDYLYYVFLDLIIDDSMFVEHKIEQEIFKLERDLLSLRQRNQIDLYQYRKELVLLRNCSTQLLSSPLPTLHKTRDFILENNTQYYNDIIDHLIHLETSTKTDLETIQHMLDLFINHQSHQMNQIMTTLTIFSAIFIPLSFIAGVFGMNFIHFPLLDNPNGLLYVGLFCLLIPVGMLLYFKKKKWF